MKQPNISEDFVPVGDFKANASRWLKRLRDRDHPIVITHHGRPAGVLMSPAEFDRLQERHAFLESVARGLSDAEAGRLHSTDQVKARLERRRTQKSRVE